MGPPGAGKGTQAKRLAERFDMDHLSSGDLFRAERASGSALGRELAAYMADGRLVPDETVVRVMVKAVNDSDAPGGLLLDGFPRTVPQAEALDRQLAQSGKPLDAVVLIEADDETVVQRITGRRVAPGTGKVYHVTHLPPKTEGIDDETGEPLIQRDDDREPVVRRRLAAYRRQTAPVLDYYRRQDGEKLIAVDGNLPPDRVTASLVAALEPLASEP
jgi:adenylate kinase